MGAVKKSNDLWQKKSDHQSGKKPKSAWQKSKGCVAKKKNAWKKKCFRCLTFRHRSEIYSASLMLVWRHSNRRIFFVQGILLLASGLGFLQHIFVLSCRVLFKYCCHSYFACLRQHFGLGCSKSRWLPMTSKSTHLWFLCPSCQMCTAGTCFWQMEFQPLDGNRSKSESVHGLTMPKNVKNYV